MKFATLFAFLLSHVAIAACNMADALFSEICIDYSEVPQDVIPCVIRTANALSIKTEFRMI